MDERQREHLIGELFSVLEATGAETISQIQDGGLKSLAAMVRQLDKLEPRSAGWNSFRCRSLTKSVFCHNIGVNSDKNWKKRKGDIRK